jgi:hypothetical protein
MNFKLHIVKTTSRPVWCKPKNEHRFIRQRKPITTSEYMVLWSYKRLQTKIQASKFAIKQFNNFMHLGHNVSYIENKANDKKGKVVPVLN